MDKDFTTLLNEIVAEKCAKGDRSEDEAFRSLMKILSKLSEEIQAAGRWVEELILLLTAVCFRAQSNGCVQCALNQTLMRSLGAVDLSIRILDMLQKLKTENTDYLIGNLAVDNQFLLWPYIMAYSFMVLHTCLDEHKVEQLAQPGNTHLALEVMELCRTVRTELDVGTLSWVWLGVGDGLCVREMYTHMNIMVKKNGEF
uniref:Uncharacterized protein n=1 Tax=Oncorhynchus tshawytscha TaxID=74940 RepID=A0A8C8CGS2_ONCTS